MSGYTSCLNHGVEQGCLVPWRTLIDQFIICCVFSCGDGAFHNVPATKKRHTEKVTNCCSSKGTLRVKSEIAIPELPYFVSQWL